MLKCLLFVLLISCTTTYGKSLNEYDQNTSLETQNSDLSKDAIQDALNQILQQAINQGIAALLGALGTE